MSALAVGDGAVWVANPLEGTVSRVDRERGVVTATVPVGRNDGPVSVAVTPSAVWVANEFAGTLARIDPKRAVVAKKLGIGNRPLALTVVDGALWLGASDAGARRRGGTVSIEWSDSASRRDMDFATFYGVAGDLTNDGLTGYIRQGGTPTLAANLAESLPFPSDGGRTYAFRLRRGIRYSTGEPVRRSDVRFVLERGISNGGFADQLFSAIRGARSCRRGACDLSRGIVADDKAGTVVFHLTEPDGDLLYKLAMPFAVLLPPSVGMKAPPSGRCPRPVRTASRISTGGARCGWSAIQSSRRGRPRCDPTALPTPWSCAIACPRGERRSGSAQGRSTSSPTPSSGSRGRLPRSAAARPNSSVTRRCPSPPGSRSTPGSLRSTTSTPEGRWRSRSIGARQPARSAAETSRPRPASSCRRASRDSARTARSRPRGPPPAGRTSPRRAGWWSGRGPAERTWSSSRSTSSTAPCRRSWSAHCAGWATTHRCACCRAVATSPRSSTPASASRSACTPGWPTSRPRRPSSTSSAVRPSAAALPSTSTRRSSVTARPTGWSPRPSGCRSPIPSGREALWSRAERRVVDQAPLVAAYNFFNADLVGERIGNYQFNWVLGGRLLDQLWVR